ncbi:MAG: hypothetical protein E5V49_13475 [Mesorhizobium sp.]|nr:hypothetical protein EN848_02580 [bacterium M00.F.Ca.ET.205.01.1.1]TGU54728.1 hypothetical protein EN795_06995 [bacterium M00.F.Ca.ET.152.01.1.1]TGV38495.1 hypothetical protein EN829_006085 [Mesorhizobium sp. M00.F.Ca.ET.186.01.1.1]TGZ44300.1 hypothetical protein EN805_07000 [bacterium M00.F.Ca.ET.162.01.1.1]TIW60856.1 MAG: hypothetical protein E5V48_11790 [Mesorhizobium sp.]
MRGLGRCLRLGRCLAPLVLLATPAGSQEFDPASLDLAALIECRADVPAYNEFALWLSGAPGAVETLGWKKVASGNPFLSQYELPAEIRVFGRETRSIVFTASGPMAVLDGIGAPDLARELDVISVMSTPEKFLGEKVVGKNTENTDGLTYATNITLNVSTVGSHPGKTLAGCSYALDVK